MEFEEYRAQAEEMKPQSVFMDVLVIKGYVQNADFML